MFESIGWLEILVLVIAALFILGPERLPEAASWLARNMRKVRDYATGARQQLKSEMGSDFDEFRKPIEDLRDLRNNLNPRQAVRNFFEDDGHDYRGNGNGSYAAPAPSGDPTPPSSSSPSSSPQQRPLSYGERPPYDPDAT
ncbi:Sec-independent protein translocase protein TatB [Allokutzneria sp. A3M-2-11 16]|uniref:Sec-independent protein translocase protein TatB n=1 Tax=Allokutzneria sp. A3M-2-11 16 TaxID=2962043 RepID=UPI0020B8E15D|nr:Sec-independent protein translocase protein TatB [Allokutzneria sp. A3M-2-11 16]MCP3798604.1 Sec-independent protein translocase protein TatB [Allokutzneria sp. A3M-2-11 16]